MAEQTREEIVAGIKNGIRWEEARSLIPSEERQLAENANDPSAFGAILKKHSLGDISGLWKAKNDYILYKDAEIPEEEEKPEEEGKQGEKQKSHYAGGGAGVKKQSLEEAAKAHGEAHADEWNKTKDPTKALSIFHAQELGEQAYYDEFAKNNPLRARWMHSRSKGKNKKLGIAIDRKKQIDAAKKKGIPRPDFSWKPKITAEKRLELIARRAELKKRLGIKNAEYEAAKSVYDQRPHQVQEHLFGDKPIENIGLRKLAQEKSRELNRDRSAIEKSQRRHANRMARRAGVAQSIRRKPAVKIPQGFKAPPIHFSQTAIPASSFTSSAVNITNRIPRHGGIPPDGRWKQRHLSDYNPLNYNLRNKLTPRLPNLRNRIPGSKEIRRARTIMSMGRFFFPFLGGTWAIILIFTLVTVFSFGFGGGTAQGGFDEPPGGEDFDTEAPTPGREETPPQCAEINQALTDRYNVKITGISNCEKKSLLFSAVSRLYSHPGFKQKMGSNPVEFVSTSNSGCRGVWLGCVDNNRGVMKLNEFDTSGKSNSLWRYIITHELFHVLAGRTSVFKEYPGVFESERRNCYRETAKGPVIKTYLITPGRARSESFAEAGSLYIFNSVKSRSGSINDFRNDCPANYNWFNQNVFQ